MRESRRQDGVVGVCLVRDARDAKVAVGILAQLAGRVGGLLSGDADVDSRLGQIVCRPFGGHAGPVGGDGGLGHGGYAAQEHERSGESVFHIGAIDVANEL